jgi:protein TonB
MLRRFGCIALLTTLSLPAYAQTDAIAEWRKQMSIRLSSSKRFPPQALGQTGNVRVGFLIDRTGKLVSSWLEESTGIAALDEEALAIVQRSEPFPIPPPEAGDDKLRMAVPMTFANRPPSSVEYRNFDDEQAAIAAKMRTICRGC